MNDFIYNLCLSNLRNKENNLTQDQKREYTKYLLNQFSHEKNIYALENKEFNKIYLKASYKYAKSILENQNQNAKTILKWIVDNKETFINEKVEDIYLIGSANDLLNNKSYEIDDEELKDKCCTDYQIFQYYKKKEEYENLDAFIKEITENVRKEEKIIKNTHFLNALFVNSIEKDPVNLKDAFLFFRLLCDRLIYKKMPIGVETLRSFLKVLKNPSLKDPEHNNDPDLHKDFYDFLFFYMYSLYNEPSFLSFKQVFDFDGSVKELVDIIINRLPEHELPKVNIYIKFLYGFYKFKGTSIEQSENYFREASSSNYYKAMYFLSEVIKKSNSEEALDLYDKIIKYDTNDKKSKELNQKSNKLERACALYQKGLVYAEGLYSKAINWDIVDQCWGDSETDLCITKKDEIFLKSYIDSKYLNLQFIKYKADHGLLEAKQMYCEICMNENLSSEDDILVIYMHELCLYSNYDKKYLREIEEYARRLDVGEGVEKDKKKAAEIKQKIKEIKKQ